MLEKLDIPQKSLFKLDEVCTIVGVKPYVLRFWESEFEEVSPLVSSTGQKLFEQKDIQILAKIKSLLFDNKLSIEKAKLVLNGKLELEKATKPKKVVARSNKPLKTPKSKMANFDIDLDKLEQARSILKELNLKSQSIQQRNNWI